MSVSTRVDYYNGVSTNSFTFHDCPLTEVNGGGVDDGRDIDKRVEDRKGGNVTSQEGIDREVARFLGWREVEKYYR